MIHDDRSDSERKTHTYIVVGTDSFMSGWGLAKGGASFAAWACTKNDLEAVLAWVRNRGDMRRVRVVGAGWRPRAAHTHIYVVHPGHPALG